jgi:hypothetical protein
MGTALADAMAGWKEGGLPCTLQRACPPSCRFRPHRLSQHARDSFAGSEAHPGGMPRVDPGFSTGSRVSLAG